MSQEEIIEVLEKEKRPMSRGEIAFALQKDALKITHQLAQLLKFSEIKCIEIDRFEAKKRFRCNRRMFLYYT